MIELIVDEELLEGVNAYDQEGEEHDHVCPRFECSNHSEGRGDDEGEYYFFPAADAEP